MNGLRSQLPLWTIARRTSAAAFLVLLVLAPFDWFGWFRGSTPAATLLHAVYLTDPLAAVEVTLTTWRVHARVLIGAGIVVVFAIFVLRLFQLQIIEGEAFHKRSEQNSVRTIRLEGPRGKMLDREGRDLATTRAAYELQVIPNGLS